MFRMGLRESAGAGAVSKSIPSVIGNDIVSCTDILAGPGRPCLLSPVNGRHLEWCLADLGGYFDTYRSTWAPHRQSHTGKVGRYLVIWGRLNRVRLVNGYQSRAPQSELGRRTPAPAGSSRVVQSRALQSVTVRARPRFETRLSPPSFCWISCRCKTLTSVSLRPCCPHKTIVVRHVSHRSIAS